MGIILFLVDTSASMNQKTFLGMTYLDVAKGAINTFMKVGLNFFSKARSNSSLLRSVEQTLSI